MATYVLAGAGCTTQLPPQTITARNSLSLCWLSFILLLQIYKFKCCIYLLFSPYISLLLFYWWQQNCWLRVESVSRQCHPAPAPHVTSPLWECGRPKVDISNFGTRSEVCKLKVGQNATVFYEIKEKFWQNIVFPLAHIVQTIHVHFPTVQSVAQWHQ